MQQVEQRIEARAQILVGVGRQHRRLALGLDQGGDLAGKAGELLVEPLGMNHRKRVEMAQNRDPAVERLQQQEAGEGLGAAVRRLHRAQRQLVGALLAAAEDVDQAMLERPRRADILRRGNVAVVEHHPLGLHLAHPRQPAQHAAVGLVAGHAEAQVRPGEVDRLTGPLIGEIVGDLGFFDQEAGVGTGAVGLAEFLRADLGGGKRQVDRGVAGVVGQIQRRRRRQFIGNGKGRAIGHDPAGADYGEFSERGHVLVDDDLAQSPRVGAQQISPRLEPRIERAVGLLEMLRAEELTLSPGYAIASGHADPPIQIRVA